jgi:hypothetical protein
MCQTARMVGRGLRASPARPAEIECDSGSGVLVTHRVCNAENGVRILAPDPF